MAILGTSGDTSGYAADPAQKRTSEPGVGGSNPSWGTRILDRSKSPLAKGFGDGADNLTVCQKQFQT